MRSPHRILYGAAMVLLGLALLLVPLAAIGPAGRTQAAPLANIPTATPMLPTAEPSATPVPPTATPTNTPVPPTATPTNTPVPPPPDEPEDEPEDDPDPTATPQPSATPQPQPSATPQPRGEVSIEKMADKSQARPGDTVIFTIRAWAISGPVRDVVVTDLVPPEFEVVNLASTYREVIVEGQKVTAYPSELATSQEVIITVTTRVRPEAQAGMLTNTAMITTSTPGDDPGDNTSTTEIEILPPEQAPPPTAQPVVPIEPLGLPDTADPILDQAGMWFLILPTLLGVALIGMGGLVLANTRMSQRLELALRPIQFSGSPARAAEPSRVQPSASLGSSPVTAAVAPAVVSGQGGEEGRPPSERSAPEGTPTGKIGAALPEARAARPLPPLVRKQRRTEDGPKPPEKP